MEEIWKDIDGTNGMYRVSNFGNIYSVFAERILKKNVSNRGYERVTINRKQVSVHRIVSSHFLEKKQNKEIVNHINGIKTDNRVENLEWVTSRENTIHYLSDKPIKEIKLKKCTRYEKWIFINGKSRRIGRFKTREEAHNAYNKLLESINT
jgi:hypothetical protein